MAKSRQTNLTLGDFSRAYLDAVGAWERRSLTSVIEMLLRDHADAHPEIQRFALELNKLDDPSETDVMELRRRILDGD